MITRGLQIASTIRLWNVGGALQGGASAGHVEYIKEHEAPSGVWVTLSDDEGYTLNAFLPPATHAFDPGVTVYWPAVGVARHMHEFFSGSLPLAREGVDLPHRFAEFVAYPRGATDPRRFDIHDLWGDFAQFEFIRFEFFARSHRRTLPSSPDNVLAVHQPSQPNRIERSILVAWANLESGKRQSVPPDAAGVLFMRRHLPGLHKRLAQLIATTSTERPDLASISALIRALNVYLSPDATPMAMSA